MLNANQELIISNGDSPQGDKRQNKELRHNGFSIRHNSDKFNLLVNKIIINAYEGFTQLLRVLPEVLTEKTPIDIIYPKSKDTIEVNFLHFAIIKRHTKALEYIINECIRQNISIDSLSSDGFTPLMQAAHLGYEKGLKILLENGATVDTADKDGSTALIFAASKGHEKTVKLLLESNANINKSNNIGQTPLQVAIGCKSKNVVKLLLKNNAIVIGERSNNHDIQNMLNAKRFADSFCKKDKLKDIIFNKDAQEIIVHRLDYKFKNAKHEQVKQVITNLNTCLDANILSKDVYDYIVKNSSSIIEYGIKESVKVFSLTKQSELFAMLPQEILNEIAKFSSSTSHSYWKWTKNSSGDGEEKDNIILGENPNLYEGDYMQ
jgi:hypothetical protein